MLSMMQLASVSNPSFRQRYRYMSYLFVFTPVVSCIIYLVRERARILDDYGSLLYGLIPAIIFLFATLGTSKFMVLPHAPISLGR